MPYGRLAKPEVRLGGSGSAGQSSGGAGPVPGTGCYVQFRRGGMEPCDAPGASAAPGSPHRTWSTQVQPPFLSLQLERPRVT